MQMPNIDAPSVLVRLPVPLEVPAPILVPRVPILRARRERDLLLLSHLLSFSPEGLPRQAHGKSPHVNSATVAAESQAPRWRSRAVTGRNTHPLEDLEEVPVALVSVESPASSLLLRALTLAPNPGRGRRWCARDPLGSTSEHDAARVRLRRKIRTMSPSGPTAPRQHGEYYGSNLHVGHVEYAPTISRIASCTSSVVSESLSVRGG
ncbi:hypothetical protein C8Q80DRAFT_770429 [Daedaleopsis nitida]|nr:hypothetical protein C8Q80DRAFT_770429 [Daedaleopsis nitida]